MFVPLRLHSVYSRGKGSVTLEEAAEWAGRQRLPAAALADVGNIYGWGKWKRGGAGGRIQAHLRLRARVRRPAVRLPGQGACGLLEPDGDLQPQGDPRCLRAHRDLHPRAGGGKRGERSRDAGRAPWESRAGRPLPRGGFLEFPPHLGICPRFLSPACCPSSGPTPSSTSPAPSAWSSSTPSRRRSPTRRNGPAPGPDEALRTAPGGAGPAPLRRRREGRPGPDGRSRREVRVRLRERRPQPPGRPLPRTLREVVMERLAAAKDLAWKERQRARRELARRSSNPASARTSSPSTTSSSSPAAAASSTTCKGSGASSFLAWLLGLSHVRPPGVRSLFRALPQPRPARPARHRHRFRLPAPRRGPEVRSRTLRRRQDRRGLRLQPEELRRPVRALRDAPGVRPAARGVAGPVRKRVPYFAEPSSCSGWPPGAGPPRRLEARRRAPGRLPRDLAPCRRRHPDPGAGRAVSAPRDFGQGPAA